MNGNINWFYIKQISARRYSFYVSSFMQQQFSSTFDVNHVSDELDISFHKFVNVGHSVSQ